jgi:hypothetical protein
VVSGNGGLAGEYRQWAQQITATLADHERRLLAAEEVAAEQALRLVELSDRVDAAHRQLLVLVRLWVEQAAVSGRLASRLTELEGCVREPGAGEPGRC